MNARKPIDSESVLPAIDREGVMMLYDWFKHMTTLSLVTLGGMLGIASGEPSSIKPGILGALLIAIAVAGIAGFDGMNRLLIAELEGRPLPSVLRWSRRLAMASYCLGVGAFLALIVESLE